jgi:hypothetical protein
MDVQNVGMMLRVQIGSPWEYIRGTPHPATRKSYLIISDHDGTSKNPFSTNLVRAPHAVRITLLGISSLFQNILPRPCAYIIGMILI